MKLSAQTKKELKKSVKYLTSKDIADYSEYNKYKTERGAINSILRREEELRQQIEKKKVMSIYIDINWHITSTGEHNPSAQCSGFYEDGEYFVSRGYRCGGAGYDKESTIFSYIFNDFLRCHLYEARHKKSKPYGVYCQTAQKENFRLSFEYGVGVDSYEEIVKFLGGEMQHSVSKLSDTYIIRF